MAPKKPASARNGKAKASNPKTSQHKVRKPPPRKAKTAVHTGKAATPDEDPAAHAQASRRAAPKKAPPQKAPAKKAAPKTAAPKATTSKASTSSGKATKAKARKTAAAKNPKHVRKGNFRSRGGINYVLTTTAEVRAYDQYDSCKRIKISLQLKRGKGPNAEVDGNFVAWIVDKTVQDPDGAPLWRWEFLEQDDLNEDDETLEMRKMLRLLYFKRGGPKKAQQLKNHQEGLSEEKLIFIDTLELPDEYRGTGLARRALEDFHSIVQEDLEATLIVLSPAKGTGSVWRDRNGRALTELQIERRLITLYRSTNYEVWIKGKGKGGETVMGQVLGDANEEEDEEADDDE